MKPLLDLDTFTQILTDKGYSGYFHTQGAYGGRLKESISSYLENCRKGADILSKENLLLSGYLQWTGDEKPRIECILRVKYLDGSFSLNGMEISKKDRFGQLLKKTELQNLSVLSAPKAAEAAALVNEDLKQKSQDSPKRFKL